MKYIVICLLLIGCGSITESIDEHPDSRQFDVVPSADINGTGGTNGSGGNVSLDTGTGGYTPTGSGGSSPGTGGVQGSGGSTQATGGNNGSGGSTPVALACGLSLPICPDTVRSVYFSLVYAIPNDTTGSREARICAINAQGVSIVDDKGSFDNVRCGNCAMGIASGKRGVYNCLIPAFTVLGVHMTLPITTETAVYCLPPNGNCPDVGVKYTKWDGHESINGEQ